MALQLGPWDGGGGGTGLAASTSGREVGPWMRLQSGKW